MSRSVEFAVAEDAGRRDARHEGWSVPTSEARHRADVRRAKAESEPEHAACWLEMAAYWDAYADEVEAAITEPRR